MDHSCYGFTGKINRVGCWENTRKACESRVVRHLIHEMTRQTNHSNWKNGNTDSAPDTKSAEQSNDNISRWESFKKGKGYNYQWKAKSILTRKYSDGEMQGFVGGINHHKSKRLYEKWASSLNFMFLVKWFIAVFNDNFPKFCKWNKG